eukprot:66673-Rhodomonas_salina.14
MDPLGGSGNCGPRRSILRGPGTRVSVADNRDQRVLIGCELSSPVLSCHLVPCFFPVLHQPTSVPALA